MARSWVLLMSWLACMTAGAAHSAQPQVTEGFINASVGEVWRLFTTSESFTPTGAAHGETELRIGGSIRTRYPPEGASGTPITIVSEILAFEPQRMLAMRIKQAPADFPFKQAMLSTWTVLYLAPAGSMTQVRIVGLGYGDDQESQAMRNFFEKSNRAALDLMAKPFWPKCAHCAAE
jgi:uncharacterized protein YndB with AHSA1/START domain